MTQAVLRYAKLVGACLNADSIQYKSRYFNFHFIVFLLHGFYFYFYWLFVLPNKSFIRLLF